VGKITIRSLPQVVTLDNRDTLNARVGMDIGKVELSIFATNIFNDDTPVMPPVSVFYENTEQQPRTIGVNARIGF